MINKRNIFKRIISILTVVTIIIPTFTQLAISAEETDKYPYNIFGRNGIEINAGNLCINGDVHTNKEANITAYGKNINGKITTGNDIEKRVKHVYADTKIHEKYFTENCELYEDGYVKSEMNIHINSPIFSYRNIELDGNVALNSNIGTLMNINVTGEVKNANTSVVYSKYGNITIENDSTANINGLIYAPLGTLTINSPNVSINGIIIADKIIINGNSINLNGNDNIARFIGTESEVYDFSDLEYLPEDWLGDTDEDDLFDIYEKVIDTDPLKPDTDGDKLPDGYEVLTLNTDPLEVDTDENGVSDADEDFDNDNLNNLGEYENKTGPFNPDTDDDGLLDGDEIKKYKTDPLNSDTDNDGLLDGEEGYNGTIYKKNGVYFDPLNPDTNGNGILDGDEVFRQYKKQEVSTYDEAITEINVSMSTNGSLERNLKIESMYGIDAMSSDVFAMIGEPFNFETSTKFNEARITFKIDQSKLGDTEFDNLIILWYNEKEQIFEEMPTTRNKAQSTISTKTTHFSQYIIVDSEKWYANWEASFTELRKMWNGGTTSYKEMNTIFVIDCCSDMETIDSSNQRLNICSNIVNGMMSEDRAAVITYSEYGTRGMTGLTDKNSVLSILSSYIRNSGAKSNLTPAFADAVNIANSSSAEMNRIIILTNGNTQFTLDLGGYNLSNVTVNVVDMGGYTMSEALMNVASVTGGSVYGIASASDLAYQVGDTIYTPPQFIGEDSDGDGIPDIVELYGLLPNGKPINTNPYLKDTDGDGLDDNVELNYLGNLFYPLTQEQLYVMSTPKSDPTKKDSDGDGISDDMDEYPMWNDPDPLGPSNIQSIQYINIPVQRSDTFLDHITRFLPGVNDYDFTLSIVKSKKIDDDIFFAYAEGVTNTGGFAITDELKSQLNNLEDGYQKHGRKNSTIEEAAAHAAKEETDQLVPKYFEYGSSAYYGCWAYNCQAEIELLNYYTTVIDKATNAYMIYITILGLYQSKLASIEQNSVTISNEEYIAANHGTKPQIEININSKQLGKKWGKHKVDYPEMSNYSEYEEFAKNVFRNPDKIVLDYQNGEYFYIKDNNLLRVKLNGEFVSLYPGADSSKVINAINSGGTIWEN